MKAEAVFVDGLRFVAKADSNRSVVLDGATAGGGGDSAIHPAELVLVGLIGCTGMDVVSILRKMRVEFTELRITAEAEREPDPPKPFTSIKVTYSFKGSSIPEDKVERAIQLSEERYCTVAASLERPVPVMHEYRITEE